MAVATLAVAGALITRATGIRPPYWIGSAAGFVTILLASVWMFGLILRTMPRRQAIGSAVGVLALTAIVEVVGLSTGYPFGRYHYTRLWQPGIFLNERGRWFPLALPLTWFILASACVLIVRSRTSGWRAILLAGLALSVVDAVLEPVMIGPVGFWRWDEPGPLLGAPWTNSAGWMLTGVLAATLLAKAEPDEQTSREAAILLTAVLAGTILIGVGHGYFEGLWAALPLSAVVMLARLHRPRGR